MTGDPVIPLRIRLAEVCAELREAEGSMLYAFACADQCCMPDHPKYREIRERVDDLRALVKELTP